jgi:hypothetical protein
MQAIQLPNFLIVGAMKAGTTTMHEILKQHSRITMSETKELHFFDYEEKYKLGRDFYSAMFDISPDSIAVGEATPIYLFHPEVPKRIIDMLGDETKIIILLRNPSDRTISHYKMMIQYDREKDSIEAALKKNLERIANGEALNRDYSYIERSMYYEQVKRYFDLFPRENIKIVLFEEEFITDRKLLIKETFDFLGVPFEDVSVSIKLMPTTNPISKKLDQITNSASPINQALKKIIPSKKIRKSIKYFANGINSKSVITIDGLDEVKHGLTNNIFYDDIKSLEGLIKRDLSCWYKTTTK